MKSLFSLLALSLAVAAAQSAEPAARTITTGTLLEEMTDLAALARWPQPTYRDVQFSSYDRRSTTPEAPGWFSNADGFGGEPIPGFAKTLRQPEGGKPGLYLLADVRRPGAIVRGWSAGMEGVLRVYLDPPAEGENANDGTLIYEGPAYEFLARRSAYYLKAAGIELDAKNAFIQQDADYLPIPYSRGLKITWEGNLLDLHFYHLQIREYADGTIVKTFDPKTDLKKFEPQLRAAVGGLTNPTGGEEGTTAPLAATIESNRSWTETLDQKESAAVRELILKIRAEKLDEALRGCLLRISFDFSQRPQVEAPLGDFFASGPGINPFSSLPFTVAADGTMTCRFVMPYRKTVRLEIVNHTAMPVELEGRIRVSPWKWDDGSMYFHAKWRVDPDLFASRTMIDLPYAFAIGKGVFVGCAAMIMNPTGVPTAGGNWWGEGDEKFLVDGEKAPSVFGTGSEDYFNYSWSRPDLFAHPYCGQPLDSGPDTAGFISNHRFQVLDAVPFEKSLAAIIELCAHSPTPGLSYARIAYYYARPDSIDDHRALMPADMKIQPLPRRDIQAAGGATGAKILHFDDLKTETTAGKLETVPLPLATHLHVAQWQAEKGGKLKFALPVEKDGKLSLHLIAVHRPDGAVVRAFLDGKPLTVYSNAADIPLRSAFAPRVLNVNFQPVEVKAGLRTVELECIEPGVVGLDSLWMKVE
ncbi:MAG: DUF2961 domain-containing protein [Pirellulales bacterium]|nr:DUF2961 domain-containing protein [Pirellulales bacterium]